MGNRLTPRHARFFQDDTAHDAVGREICEASCLPQKEFEESWQVAVKVLRRHRGGAVFDLAGGHGLVAWLMLFLDRKTPQATVVDTRIPESAGRLRTQLHKRWPHITDRWVHQVGTINGVEPSSDDRILGVHACGSLTDEVLALATQWRCRVAVLPCCHSHAKLDDGGLSGWMPPDVAIDATRARNLADQGFRVYTTTIEASVTPKNRLLLGTPR